MASAQTVSDFLEVTGSDIRTAAEKIKTASQNLRDSYNIASENDGLEELRADVFNNAKLYQDKIIPFSNETINSIHKFCTDIDKFDLKGFEEFLEEVKNNARSNKILCDYTVEFNKAILVKFKEIEDKVYKKEILQNSSLLLLKNSIESYICSLKSFAGFLTVLLMTLTTLKDRVERATSANSMMRYYHKIIQFRANEIISSCVDYITIQPAYITDLDCIQTEPNSRYIDEWFSNETKNHDKYDNFQNIVKKNPLLKAICGIN